MFTQDQLDDLAAYLGLSTQEARSPLHALSRLVETARLSGGLAYDVDRILDVTLQATAILAAEIRNGAASAQAIDAVASIEGGARQAKRHIERFRRASQPPMPETIDLNALVAGMETMPTSIHLL